MTRKDAEEHLFLWGENSPRLYQYRIPLVPVEYISIIKKDDMYFSKKENSTYLLPDMDKEEFVRKLMSRELVFETESTWGMTALARKTGGCVCGGWINGENATHSYGCDLFHKNTEKKEKG